MASSCSTASPCEVAALNSCSMTGHQTSPVDGCSALVTASENVVEDSEACMKDQLVALENQRVFWRAYHRNSPTWAFFATNDSSPVDSVKPQLMRCIICHPSRRETSEQRNSRSRKGVVVYNKEHGTTAMKKHVQAQHPEVFVRYKAMQSPCEPSLIEPRPYKKRSAPAPGTITYIFGSANPYKKDDELQQRFLEDLALYIVKGYRPLSEVENIWLRRLVLRQSPRLVFPSRREFVDEVIPKLATKTMEKHVLPLLAGCITATVSFDLWVSRGGWDTYALVVSFINDAWIPCHLTIGLFETPDTSWAEVAVQIREILSHYNLASRVIAYVKDGDANLGSMTAALAYVVSCKPLELAEPYAGNCFGHAMAQCCQQATDDSKVCAGLRVVSLRDAQASLQRTITWTTDSEKGRHEWEEACIDSQLPPRKLKVPVKTRFASKVILFRETLEYKEAIFTCYSRQSLEVPVPTPQAWAVARAVSETLIPVVAQCVLNQTRGHWLLSDALAAALSLSVELRQERWLTPAAEGDGDGEFDGELSIFQSRMRKEVLSVLEPCLSFATTFSRQEGHNMLALMLDPRFKGLGLVRNYVGADKVKGIVSEYDMQVLLPLLMQCFKRLHPTAQSQQPVTPVSEDSIFGAQASAEEVILEQLKFELSMFRRLPITNVDCEGPLAWWRGHEKEFPTVAFLARQILGIVGSQVETERIFSVAGVITSLQRRKLGSDDLEKLVLIAKNWPDDTRSDGKLAVASVSNFLAAEDGLIDDIEYLFEETRMFEE